MLVSNALFDDCIECGAAASQRDASPSRLRAGGQLVPLAQARAIAVRWQVCLSC